MATQTKNEARDLFLGGATTDLIATRLGLEREMIEVWRDEGCWGPVRNLADATACLSNRVSADETDDLRAMIVDALFEIIVRLAQIAEEASIEDLGDVVPWAKIGRCTTKALKIAHETRKDIKTTRRIRHDPRATSGPCRIERPGSLGPPGMPPFGNAAGVSEAGADDDQAHSIIAGSLSGLIVKLVRVLKGAFPKDAKSLEKVARLVLQMLGDLRVLREIAKDTESSRRVREKERRIFGDHAA